MYRLSKKPIYIKETNVNTHRNRKIMFRLMSKCTGEFLGSPLYRDGILWDKLDKNVQEIQVI